MNKKYFKVLLLSIMLACSAIKAYAAETVTAVKESTVEEKTHKVESVGVVKSKAPVNNALPLNVNRVQIIDRIVVFVNKSVITSEQVDAGVRQTLYNLKEKGLAAPNLTLLRNQVLEQLIMQEIQLGLAKSTGIKTSDIETTDAINNMLKQQNISLEQLKAKLTSSGLTFNSFRQQIQDQITIEKLKQREVGGRISVSENEVNRILSSEMYKHKVEYRLSDIVLNIPEHASDDIVKQKEALANEAYNALKAGQPFMQVVVKYSNGPNALSGGEIGWKSNVSLPPIISHELEPLPVGGFTNVIQLPMGFFIFKINETRKYGEAQFVKQYHVRHILIKVNETRSDEEAYDKIQLIKKLLDKDRGNQVKLDKDFIKYAKEYSEDTSSVNGGDLNWISRGDTVPAFESAVLATPVGVISQPIHSPFGWHLLQVIGVRDSNLATDREKAEIRQELRVNKANMIYEQWLRDIRDMAYVKMNQD